VTVLTISQNDGNVFGWRTCNYAIGSFDLIFLTCFSFFVDVCPREAQIKDNLDVPTSEHWQCATERKSQ
jgi:hypothetical protein